MIRLKIEVKKLKKIPGLIIGLFEFRAFFAPLAFFLEFFATFRFHKYLEFNKNEIENQSH